MVEHKPYSGKKSHRFQAAFVIVLFACNGGALFYSYRTLRPTLAQESAGFANAPRQISLSETGDSGHSELADQVGRPSLRLAVAPMLSPESNLAIYDPLAEYLGKMLGREPVLQLRHCYGDVNDLLRAGWCDVAMVSSYAFVQSEREIGLRVLVAPEINGSSYSHSYIVVPQSSSASSLLDLKGKRFAYVDFLSSTGWLYPVAWLSEHGEDPRKFFSGQFITDGHDNSLRAVLDGYVDGAAVDSTVYDSIQAARPRLAHHTKVIDKSPALALSLLVVPRMTDHGLEERLREILLTMKDTPDGQKVLRRLRFDRFVRADNVSLDEVKQLAEKAKGR